jgi:hypothetical protein
MGIVDDLLARPGLYLGIDIAKRVESNGAARIRVTPLPGGAGVTLDYETSTPRSPTTSARTSSTPSSAARTTAAASR